jgi:prolyl-tRNA editing enzyme YbaK/EbsC (Cys-tRNA(Pro) deacylase)
MNEIPDISLTPSEQRVADAIASYGLPTRVVVLPHLATTAQMAAEALGVDIGRIVKSLLFKGAETGRPIMLLVSGQNRVHGRRVGRQIGEKLERADADLVRTATGFAIGGVSPFGYPAPLPVYMDRQLMTYQTVWAAAGNARSVFEIAPTDLERTTRATVLDVT